MLWNNIDCMEYVLYGYILFGKDGKFCCFVNKLPLGYNAPIGEIGARLSGGGRQRISIARALLKDAPIILLDEATASLDVENETKIQEALSHLLKGKQFL